MAESAHSKPGMTEEAVAQVLERAFAELRSHGHLQSLAEVGAALASQPPPPARADLHSIATHFHFHRGEYERSLAHAQAWRELQPGEPKAMAAELGCLRRLRRWPQVLALAHVALAREPESHEWHSAASHAYAYMDRMNEARGHGTLCLAFKDRAASGAARDLTGVRVPPFRPQERARHVVAFSLFGHGEKYLRGALENARAMPHIYPAWQCRFYVDDSVPERVLEQLRQLGAHVHRVDGLTSGKFGTFWRFLVAQDDSVERFLVRDCDSVVNLRERLAVDEWLASGRHFHVMRDFVTHCDLMLAGMWGGVGGVLSGLDQAFIRFVQERLAHRTMDQEFLRMEVWPTVRQSVMVHDSQFAFGQRRDFPKGATLPPGRHVGQAM